MGVPVFYRPRVINDSRLGIDVFEGVEDAPLRAH